MNQRAITWNDELNCPIVYVAGTCITSEDFAPLASYGIYWGFKDPKNKSGPVKIEPTELRAELWGLKKALQIAVEQRIPRLIIRTKSGNLNTEMEMWDQSNSQEKQNHINSDILTQIDQWKNNASQYMYWMADVAPHPDPQAKGHRYALHFATLNATKFSVKVPKEITVAIHGACLQEGQKNPKASFGVFWGDGDNRNTRGLVEGQQTHLRAEFCALRAVLNTALKRKITKIVILTRNNATKLGFGDNGNNKKHDKVSIVGECKELAEKFNSVTIQHVPSSEQSYALDTAKAMAKQQDRTVDANGNDLFPETMNQIDLMILDVDESEVPVRGTRGSEKAAEREKKKISEKHRSVSSKRNGSKNRTRDYVESPQGSIKVYAYDQSSTKQRPLKADGYQRADGVHVYIGRT